MILGIIFFSVWDILKCTWFLHECRYSIFLKNCNEFLKLWTHYFKLTRFNVTQKKIRHIWCFLCLLIKNRFFLTKGWLLCNSKHFCQERVVIMVYPIIQDENKALDKTLIPSCSKNWLIRTFCNKRSLVLNKNCLEFSMMKFQLWETFFTVGIEVKILAQCSHEHKKYTKYNFLGVNKSVYWIT